MCLDIFNDFKKYSCLNSVHTNLCVGCAKNYAFY